MVYRGKNYEGPSSEPLLSTDTASVNSASAVAENTSQMLPQEHRENLTAQEVEYNKLLDGLGPRFVDWWGTGILPVDGDLLPQTIPDFMPPLRLLPARMRLGLTNAELTNLRKLAKSLPCHFALGMS